MTHTLVETLHYERGYGWIATCSCGRRFASVASFVTVLMMWLDHSRGYEDDPA